MNENEIRPPALAFFKSLDAKLFCVRRLNSGPTEKKGNQTMFLFQHLPRACAFKQNSIPYIALLVIMHFATVTIQSSNISQEAACSSVIIVGGIGQVLLCSLF